VSLIGVLFARTVGYAIGFGGLNLCFHGFAKCLLVVSVAAAEAAVAGRFGDVGEGLRHLPPHHAMFLDRVGERGLVAGAAEAVPNPAVYVPPAAVGLEAVG
jgi:hypothetical protein